MHRLEGQVLDSIDNNPMCMHQIELLGDLLIEREYLVVCTGVGKSFHVAQLAASLLQSVGIAASAVHATDMLHGSLGMVQNHTHKRMLLAFTHSGETAEVVEVLRRTWSIRKALITGNPTSKAAGNTHSLLAYNVERDGSIHGSVPAHSLIGQLAIVNRIVARIADSRSKIELAHAHPGGVLYEGKN